MMSSTTTTAMNNNSDPLKNASASSSKLALAIIQAEEGEEVSQSSSGYSTVEGHALPPKSPFQQSPNDIEHELLSSLAHLHRRKANKPRITNNANTNNPTTSHRDSKDSLLVTTLQRMDSGDLDDILGIDNAAGKELSKPAKRQVTSAPRKKPKQQAPSEIKKQRNPSLLKKLEEDKKKQQVEEEEEEDQTVLSMREMKEIFQKEHPGVELPNDETLKQRYRKGKPSKQHCNYHHHHYRKTKKSSKSRLCHSSHHSSRTTSPSVHSSSTTKKGSVHNILSQEKWGHASMDNIITAGMSMSNSSHHHKKSSRHGNNKSARCHSSSRHSKSAPGRAAGHHSSLTDHLLQQKKITTATTPDKNNTTFTNRTTTIVDLMPPIPFDSQNSSKDHNTMTTTNTNHGHDEGEDDHEGIHEFAGDSDEESIVVDELAAPSIHVPITVDRMQGHSSPTVTTTNKKALAHLHASPTVTTTSSETPLTAPHSWGGGGDTQIITMSQSSSSQQQQYPMSATTMPSNNSKKKRTTFLKNKLRALLKGGNGNDDNSTNIVDYDDMIEKELKKGAGEEQDDVDGPIPAIRRTLSLTKKTTNPPGKSRMGSVLSNVLGRNSMDPTKFGELGCPSLDDDDHLLVVGESEHKDVTVALESTTQGMYLDEHSHDESTLTKEQQLAKMQQEQEKVMRQVEEARIATRRIRKSHRRKRNSKSPSRLIGSDHVPTKSIRDPVKPTTSNSSVRSERSRSVESLKSSRKSKTTETEILRKASHRSERRRARSIDASKHRKTEGRRRSRSIDGGKQRAFKDHTKPSEERQGRRRSRSFDAEALKNEGQPKDKTKRKATRKSHQKHSPSSASPATRRKPKPSTKRKNLSTGSIGSPYLTPASTLRRPSGDGDEKDNTAVAAITEADRHHKITGGGGIQHRREATQTIRERQQKHHKEAPQKESPPFPTEASEPKPVRRLLSIEPPPPIMATATATGEPTQEFNMDEWVSDDSDEEGGGAFSVDAGHGL